MDEIAARAGVSKATIYRRWPTKETLALDALGHEWPAVPQARGGGSLRDGLLALVHHWAQLFTSRPYDCVITALIAQAQADPGFNEEYQSRFVEPRREEARILFRRAIERGQLAPATDVELAVDLLYGPLYYRLLHRNAPFDEGVAGDVVDAVLGGLDATQT
jgi:AcrR family transcriptional regulator